jgi:hypothetical protein
MEAKISGLNGINEGLDGGRSDSLCFWSAARQLQRMNHVAPAPLNKLTSLPAL